MKMKLIARIVLIALLAPLGARSASAQVGSPPRATRPSVLPENYRLTPNDVVSISVFQENELDTTARISKDGTIPFPLIGSVPVGGRTVQESARVMEEMLKEYFVHPQVSIRILDYSKRRFTVLGQVAKPGTYDIPDETTLSLLEAIGMAGGYTRIANPAKITVKRRINGEETIFKLDAKSMLKNKDQKVFEVLPGDTIFIGESFI